MITLITQEMLNRINELARKKRSVGLSTEEIAEQKQLYQAYLENIRGQMINLLDNIEIVDGNADGIKKNETPRDIAKVFQQTQVVLGRRIFH